MSAEPVLLVAVADVVALLLDVSAEAVVSGSACSVVGGVSSPELEQPTASAAVRTVTRERFVIRITLKCNE